MSHTFKVQAARIVNDHRSEVRGASEVVRKKVALLDLTGGLAGSRFGNQRKNRAAMKTVERRAGKATYRVACILAETF